MNLIKNIFFGYACAGWCIGLTVHIAGYLGYKLSIPELPWFIGPAPLFLFTLIYASIENRKAGFGSRINLKHLLRRAPAAIRYLSIASFFYGPISMFIAQSSRGSKPSDLTDAIMDFSFFWISFCGIAIAALYPGSQVEKSDGEQM